MKVTLMYLFVLAPALAGCADGRTSVPTSTRPSLSVQSGSSQQEELIGGEVFGATNTVFHATGPHINAYFQGGQITHAWGVFLYESLSTCGQSQSIDEQHYQDPVSAANLSPNPTGKEQHCGYTGRYDGIQITGGGHSWTRSIAMLGARGVLGVVPGTSDDADVLVPLDVHTPTTTLSGSLRGSRTYHAASGDTLLFSTTGATIATGDSVWFISTYIALRANGTIKYHRDEVLNSYVFDYSRLPDSAQPAVNSSPLGADHSLPFLHVFRSPGRTRDYVVRLRVVEPYDATMENGTLVDDALTYSVTADSACWTSAGGPAGTSVDFSAACSESRNAGIAEYQWVWSTTPGDTTAWSTDQTASHVFSSAGSKTVKLRIKLSTGDGGMDSTSHTVSITSPPPSLSWVDLPNPVKPNVTCTWSVAVSGGAPPVSVLWYKNGLHVGRLPSTSIDLATGTANFHLAAVATDANAAVDSVTFDVQVTSSSPSNCTY